jgi:multidrug efflux pump subunit AcrB
VQQILDEELDRLPEKLRLPVLLCCLQDQTIDEAARQLGWSLATVKGRLQRGRERLRERLRRRGVTLPAAALATILAEGAVRGVPPALVQATVTAAVSGTRSVPVAALVKGVLTTTFWNRVRTAVIVLAVVGLVGLAAGLWSFRTTPEVHAVPVPEQADEPVIVVAASYPGANARVVTDTVAHWIEQQINGVEGMMDMVSQSNNDGSYTLTVTFKPGVNRDLAQVLVQNRVNLALPQLPDAVREAGVTTRKKVGDNGGKELPAEADHHQVAIVVIDHGDLGWEELQKAAGVVVKRLAAAGALRNPQVFPRDEKEFLIDIDRAKCASLGVSTADVNKALQAWMAEHGQKAMMPESWKKVILRDKVTLGDVAVIREVYGPATVYRINLYPAIRITGAPPEGKSAAAAAAQCVDLAEADMKRLGSRGFAVENLSAK